MRTVRGWLGFARRWTPTATQRDVEEPTTVVVVGQDESDDAVLWAGEVTGFAIPNAVGLRPLVDVFVVALSCGDGAGVAAGTPVVFEVRPTGLAAGVASGRFIRSPPSSIPNAAFATNAVAQATGPPLTHVAAGVEWMFLPPPGLLVRVGEVLWANTSPFVGTPVLRAMWRA